MKQGHRIIRLAMWSAAVLAAAGAWLGYRQTEFVVWLYSAALLCT